MTVDEFVNKSARPIFNYRMARAMLGSEYPGMKKSAFTRLKKASEEIRELAEILTNYSETGAEEDAG